MTFLDIESFRKTPLVNTPFEHVVVPGFVRPESTSRLLADFPKIEQGGSFPLASLAYGGAFTHFCEELRGTDLRKAFEEKFQMNLEENPTTLTVRGRCRAKDGKVHTDSKSKLITVLVYLGGPMNQDGGKLRLLNSSDLNDYFAEIAPEVGTMIAFRNGPTAWHGHKSFSGERRALQLNWVTDQAAVKHSERRHGLSAVLKKLNIFRRVA